MAENKKYKYTFKLNDWKKQRIREIMLEIRFKYWEQ